MSSPSPKLSTSSSSSPSPKLLSSSPSTKLSFSPDLLRRITPPSKIPPPSPMKFEKSLTVGEAREVVSLEKFVSTGGSANAICRDSPQWLRWSLIHAAACSSFDATKFLLDHGADIEARTADRKTPLHVASIYGMWAIVTELLKRGADIKAKNNEGYTPYDFAKEAPSDIRLKLTPK